MMLRLILFFVLVPMHFSVAKEDAPPADSGEAKKAQTSAGGKGGDKGLPPWFQTEARIGELVAKIKAKEESLEKLIETKKGLKEGSPLTKPTVEQIVKEHKELEELVADYNKNLNLLKYRFPERGMKMERSYKKKEVQSVDNIEQAIGIDTKLARSLNKARSQFGANATAVKDKSKKKSLVTNIDSKSEAEKAHGKADATNKEEKVEVDPSKLPIDEQPALIMSK
jgi:hypothetical protein